MPILWLKGNIFDLCVIILVTFQVTITEYLTEIMRRSHGSVMVWGIHSYVWQTLFLLQVLVILALTFFCLPLCSEFWTFGRGSVTQTSHLEPSLSHFLTLCIWLIVCLCIDCYHLLQKETLLTTFLGLFSPELQILPYSSSKPVPKAHKPHNRVYFSNNSTFWYQFSVLVSFLIAMV